MSNRELPTPPNMSQDDIRQIMLTWSIDDSPPGALDGYVHDALWRFLHSWGMGRYESGRCLELGGNPYFITWLLHKHTSLELTLANYFGPNHSVAPQTLSWTGAEGRESLQCNFDHFNLEDENFPYGDASFNVVYFCEIIEHLLMDPLHPLREINRILIDGGLLVLSTPNVARLGNVFAMLDGRSIYDPYSGYGPYGRHNREFNMEELVQLLIFAGFDICDAFTADAHPENYTGNPKYSQVLDLCSDRRGDLGQYLFVSARKRRPPIVGFPRALYRSWPDDQLTNW